MDTSPHVLDEVVAAMEKLVEEIPGELDTVYGAWKDAAEPMKISMVLNYGFTHNGKLLNIPACNLLRYCTIFLSASSN